MLFSKKARTILFQGFAILFLLAAIYHIVGAFFYKVDDSPAWRHLLFVGINLWCMYGVLKRPAYFVYVVVLLLIQQYYSHGTYMMRLWAEQKQIHWISVVDLLLLPVAFICLMEDAKMKRAKK